MAGNISEDVPLLEGLATVVSGQQSCDICHFANENNPIEDRGELQIALIEIIPLSFPFPQQLPLKAFLLRATYLLILIQHSSPFLVRESNHRRRRLALKLVLLSALCVKLKRDLYVEI